VLRNAPCNSRRRSKLTRITAPIDEGVISKHKSAKYHSGRNEAWIKITCRYRETFVIAGLAFNGGKFDGVY
jgi:ATP-dependent DNA ligase